MKYDPRLGSPAPHPDHFDANKFGANGLPIGRNRRGRTSAIRAEDVAPLLELERRAIAAKKALYDFLGARGYKARHQTGGVLRRLRGGWRPVK